MFAEARRGLGEGWPMMGGGYRGWDMLRRGMGYWVMGARHDTEACLQNWAL